MKQANASEGEKQQGFALLMQNFKAIGRLVASVLNSSAGERTQLLRAIRALNHMSRENPASLTQLPRLAKLASNPDPHIWHRIETAIENGQRTPLDSLQRTHTDLIDLGYRRVIPQLAYSQEGEELILTRMLESRKGFYVDVGAHHPIRFSNTYLLSNRGWHGINIDPTPGLEETFLTARPRDKFFPCGISDQEGELTFYAFEDGAYNTFDKAEKERLEKTKNIVCKATHTIPVRTLNSILEEEHVESIDLLTIDVEGLELAVLAGFDIERYRPEIIIVEIKRDLIGKLSEHEIYRYLTTRGYTIFSMLYNSAIFKRN